MARRGLVIVLASLVAVPSAFGGQKAVKPDRPAINRAARRVHPGRRRAEGPEARLAARRRRRARRLATASGSRATRRFRPTRRRARRSTAGSSTTPIRATSASTSCCSRGTRSMGAWSFRAEAQKLGGSWKITTWYPVASSRRPGRRRRCNGPADLGPGAAPRRLRRREPPRRVGARDSGRASSARSSLGALAFAGTRWWRRRQRVRAIERAHSASDR